MQGRKLQQAITNGKFFLRVIEEIKALKIPEKELFTNPIDPLTGQEDRLSAKIDYDREENKFAIRGVYDKLIAEFGFGDFLPFVGALRDWWSFGQFKKLADYAAMYSNMQENKNYRKTPMEALTEFIEMGRLQDALREGTSKDIEKDKERLRQLSGLSAGLYGIIGEDWNSRPNTVFGRQALAAIVTAGIARELIISEEKEAEKEHRESRFTKEDAYRFIINSLMTEEKEKINFIQAITDPDASKGQKDFQKKIDFTCGIATPIRPALRELGAKIVTITEEKPVDMIDTEAIVAKHDQWLEVAVAKIVSVYNTLRDFTDESQKKYGDNKVGVWIKGPDSQLELLSKRLKQVLGPDDAERVVYIQGDDPNKNILETTEAIKRMSKVEPLILLSTGDPTGLNPAPKNSPMDYFFTVITSLRGETSATQWFKRADSGERKGTKGTGVKAHYWIVDEDDNAFTFAERRKLATISDDEQGRKRKALMVFQAAADLDKQIAARPVGYIYEKSYLGRMSRETAAELKERKIIDPGDDDTPQAPAVKTAESKLEQSDLPPEQRSEVEQTVNADETLVQNGQVTPEGETAINLVNATSKLSADGQQAVMQAAGLDTASGQNMVAAARQMAAQNIAPKDTSFVRLLLALGLASTIEEAGQALKELTDKKLTPINYIVSKLEDSDLKTFLSQVPVNPTVGQLNTALQNLPQPVSALEFMRAIGTNSQVNLIQNMQRAQGGYQYIVENKPEWLNGQEIGTVALFAIIRSC